MCLEGGCWARSRAELAALAALTAPRGGGGGAGGAAAATAAAAHVDTGAGSRGLGDGSSGSGHSSGNGSGNSNACSPRQGPTDAGSRAGTSGDGSGGAAVVVAALRGLHLAAPGGADTQGALPRALAALSGLRHLDVWLVAPASMAAVAAVHNHQLGGGPVYDNGANGHEAEAADPGGGQGQHNDNHNQQHNQQPHNVFGHQHFNAAAVAAEAVEAAEAEAVAAASSHLLRALSGPALSGLTRLCVCEYQVGPRAAPHMSSPTTTTTTTKTTTTKTTTTTTTTTKTTTTTIWLRYKTICKCARTQHLPSAAPRTPHPAPGSPAPRPTPWSHAAIHPPQCISSRALSTAYVNPSFPPAAAASAASAACCLFYLSCCLRYRLCCLLPTPCCLCYQPPAASTAYRLLPPHGLQGSTPELLEVVAGLARLAHLGLSGLDDTPYIHDGHMEVRMWGGACGGACGGAWGGGAHGGRRGAADYHTQTRAHGGVCS